MNGRLVTHGRAGVGMPDFIDTVSPVIAYWASRLKSGEPRWPPRFLHFILAADLLTPEEGDKEHGPANERI